MAGYPDYDYWREDGTCSFCGSISPKRLFDEIENGLEVVPTDKSYKIYVEGPDAPFMKFYFQHFRNDDGTMDKEMATKFIDLYNDGKINMGYPGHFYVNPFFMHKVPKEKKDEH